MKISNFFFGMWLTFSTLCVLLVIISVIDDYSDGTIDGVIIHPCPTQSR